MTRAYYSASKDKFLQESPDSILGKLSKNHNFDLGDLQKNAWIEQINILKNKFNLLPNSHVLFEYTIPRMGKRIDVVILFQGIIFAIEFKVGEKGYPQHAIDQVLDYSLDLKNFHEQSHDRIIVPLLLSTEGSKASVLYKSYEDNIFHVIKTNKLDWCEKILEISQKLDESQLSAKEWEESVYKPTPTIIEAAQALYKGHSVKEISRSESSLKDSESSITNLHETSDQIAQVIDDAKANNRKAICFVTGVPGAGKTLAGLNIANERHNIDEGEHAVFLSGNGPLVEVLQEALARDEVKSSKERNQKISKAEALRHTKAFIQNIHHFRDDNLETSRTPIERVAIFDEAQRAWNLEQTVRFMKQKKGRLDFNQSEPDFLISVMDRHQDWAVIVCLIGGGQEINKGEVGLPGWFTALSDKYSDWDVYVSDKLSDREYHNGTELHELFAERSYHVKNELHLGVSVRSFRSEQLSAFVKTLLDLKKDEAKHIFSGLQKKYPIAVTRELDKAKIWLRNQSRANERIGIIASSGAYRLKPHGIHIKSKIDCKYWFLNDKEDIRSSNFLEDVATQFDIQGLELDWTCLAWDADLRLQNIFWEYKKFSGTKWQNINKEIDRRYLLNTYRVLLTRARQGMVIFIPPGDENDPTRLPSFYDKLYNFFKDLGVKEV